MSQWFGYEINNPFNVRRVNSIKACTCDFKLFDSVDDFVRAGRKQRMTVRIADGAVRGSLVSMVY